jgi:hypothetical protein
MHVSIPLSFLVSALLPDRASEKVPAITSLSKASRTHRIVNFRAFVDVATSLTCLTVAALAVGPC